MNLLHPLALYRHILQLKDGEDSKVSRMTFTVELHVRTVSGNGAEQQRYTECTVLVALCFGGLCVSLARNDTGHGGCVTFHCDSCNDKSLT